MGIDEPSELKRYRDHINNINETIVKKISIRMEKVEDVKEIKDESGMSVTDKGREEKVVSQFQDLFEENGLRREHGEELAELLIEMAKEKQKD